MYYRTVIAPATTRDSSDRVDGKLYCFHIRVMSNDNLTVCVCVCAADTCRFKALCRGGRGVGNCRC